ncbi:hypothetical protein NQ317_006981 [Molorchus minor]|uniref:PiggyBac transposable element-derived protein domain-containing protein n=1 Tax=Molorchus minor TaxID=1323400 RepID=A0ABQ9IY98_9CUCU|nr:hypothetical protein NQ317_006981 [Molorchus minor]
MEAEVVWNNRTIHVCTRGRAYWSPKAGSKTKGHFTLYQEEPENRIYPINFAIYCGMSRQFRETFKDLFIKGAANARNGSSRYSIVNGPRTCTNETVFSLWLVYVEVGKYGDGRSHRYNKQRTMAMVHSERDIVINKNIV